MNRLRTFIFCAVICLLACCTREREDALQASPVPLHIASAALPGMTLETGATTRAATTLQTGSIGVFCTQPTGYTVAQKNVKYTYDSGKWKPETAGKGVYLLPQTTQVCAYYPYNGNYSNSATVPLAFGEYAGTADDLTGHDPQDICYAVNQGLNSASATVTFALKHALALLRLTFTRPADASTACRVTQLKLENNNLMQTATQDITTGTAPVGTPVSFLTWTPVPAMEVPAGGTAASVTLRMIPCTLASGGLKLTCTIEGRSVSVTIAGGTLSGFEAGKLYDVSLSIGAAGITVAEVSITDWEDAYRADDPVHNTRP